MLLLPLLLLALQPRAACSVADGAEAPSWRGIRLGSRVTRGPAWAYGDQDGGAGGEGTVVELRPWRRAGEDGAAVRGLLAARVKWDATGALNAYRWDAPGEGDGARDLALVGWRPLSVAEAGLAPSHAEAAAAEEARARGSAALVGPLRALWAALGGARWVSQRGWPAALVGGAPGGGGGGGGGALAPELLPCGVPGHAGWEGVACTPDHAGLLGLDLSGNGLAGELSEAALAALPSGLQSLNLARNALTGELPAAALCRFTDLRVLDLSFNRLRGPLPACLGELVALEVLYLANNDLQGRLPPLWARLQRLQALHLQGNARLEAPLTQPLEERLRGVPHLALPPALALRRH